MSFLFEDEVLSKILIDSGVFSQLEKQAQKAAAQAKIIANKLAQNLITQATGEHDRPDAELYVRDLVDFDTYLNFLMKNNQRYDGKLIVFRQITEDPSHAQPPNPELYVPYKTFFVYKDGLIERLRELDGAANQAGNEVMKPFVKGLVEQINGALKINYEREAPLPGERGSLGQDKQRSHVQVGFSADEKTLEDAADPNYRNVTNKPQGKAKVTNLKEDIMALSNVLPFQSPNSLSPFNMYSFIQNVSQILDKNPTLSAGPMFGQFKQFLQNITHHYKDWQQWLGQVAASTTSTGSLIAPGAASMRDELPYDRAQRPNVLLQSLFGNTHFARQAAQQLLTMVNLTQQALLSLTRSPQFMDLLGKDLVSNQTNQAKAYADSLTPFARGNT